MQNTIVGTLIAVNLTAATVNAYQWATGATVWALALAVGGFGAAAALTLDRALNPSL